MNKYTNETKTTTPKRKEETEKEKLSDKTNGKEFAAILRDTVVFPNLFLLPQPAYRGWPGYRFRKLRFSAEEDLSPAHHAPDAALFFAGPPLTNSSETVCSWKTIDRFATYEIEIVAGRSRDHRIFGNWEHCHWTVHHSCQLHDTSPKILFKQVMRA